MKIALIGYGKMGKTIEQIAIQRGHQIVSIIDINNAEDIYSEAFKSADAAIEFTTPASSGFKMWTPYIWPHGWMPCSVSGWNERQRIYTVCWISIKRIGTRCSISY